MNSFESFFRAYMREPRGPFAYRFLSKLFRVYLLQFVILWPLTGGSAHAFTVLLVVWEFAKEVADLKLPKVRSLTVMVALSVLIIGLASAMVYSDALHRAGNLESGDYWFWVSVQSSLAFIFSGVFGMLGIARYSGQLPSSIKTALHFFKVYFRESRGSFAYRFATMLARWVFLLFVVLWPLGIPSLSLMAVPCVVSGYARQVADLKLPHVRSLGEMIAVSTLISALAGALALPQFLNYSASLISESYWYSIFVHALIAFFMSVVAGVVGIASHLDKPSG